MSQPKELLALHEVKGTTFQVGSDHHWPREKAGELAQAIVAEKKSELLFL